MKLNGKLKWMDEEDKQLSAMYEQGLSDNDIAQVLGRSKGSVSGRRKRLGMYRQVQESPLKDTPKSVIDAQKRLWVKNILNFEQTFLKRNLYYDF